MGGGFLTLKGFIFKRALRIQLTRRTPMGVGHRQMCVLRPFCDSFMIEWVIAGRGHLSGRVLEYIIPEDGVLEEYRAGADPSEDL